MSSLDNDNKPTSTDLTRKQATVLVVDDTPENLSLMSGLLKDLYKVKVANNGEKALQIAASDSPPDLIPLDIMMPGIDGIQASGRIKHDSRLKRIPAIILATAYGREEIMRQAEAAGLEGFLIKPVSPSVMFDTMICPSSP